MMSAQRRLLRRSLLATGAGIIWATMLVLVMGQQPTPPAVTSGPAGTLAYYPAAAARVGPTSALNTSDTEVTSIRYRSTTEAATATLTTTDGPLVTCDTSAGNVVLTLPAASGAQGSWAIIKTTSDANTCSVQRGGSDTINGATTAIVLDAQWERADLVPTSTSNWSALLGFVTVSTSQIADDAVTFAKLQNLNASTLLGRGAAGGTGDPQPITLGTNLSMSGTVLNATSGGGGTGTLPLWPGFAILPDGTAGNEVATSALFKSSGTAPTNAPALYGQDLLFPDDGSTDRHVIFQVNVPADYASGGTLYINWRRASGTGAANVVVKCAVAAVTPGNNEVPNTKVFAAVTTTTTAAGTTSQGLVQSTCAPALDSWAARDTAWIMVGRDSNNAADTLNSVDIQVVSIWLEYTK